MALTQSILASAVSGERIDDCEWINLWENATLYELGRAAHSIRLNNAICDTVTFVVDRNVNYTNVCSSGCDFCAFYEGEPSNGYVLSYGEISSKVEDALKLGATQVLLQGGLHPHLDLSYYTGLLAAIKDCGEIAIHGFSPPEVVHISRIAGLSIDETLETLKEAGLDSIPGGGAEILDDTVRKRISPHKISASTWIDVMRKAHLLEMNSTATMMFGSVEEKEHILNHLRLVRELQDETGGFTAFIPWCFQPGNTELGMAEDFRARVDNPVRGVQGYLKLLALSRIYLDNFRNIQVSWVTMGVKIAQVALHFGANDFGSLMIEENVVKAAGISYRLELEEMVNAIKDACFRPAVRNTGYSILRYC